MGFEEFGFEKTKNMKYFGILYYNKLINFIFYCILYKIYKLFFD